MPRSSHSPSAQSTVNTDQSKLAVCNNCKRESVIASVQLVPDASRLEHLVIMARSEGARVRQGGAVNSRTRALMDRITQLEGIVNDLSEIPAATASTPSLSTAVDDSIMWSSADISTALGPLDPSTIECPFTTNLSLANSLETPTPAQLPTICTSQGLSASTLLPATEQLLISLYFYHIQPTFPLFRKPVFYQDLIAHAIPEMLLAAMFAISSRFLSSEKVQELFGDISNPWDHFSQIAHRELRHEMQKNESVTLTHVKVACLLALYEYTKAPTRQGWILVGNAVRLALLAQLHRVDCRDFPMSVSVAEREEWGFVWWTVWRLDCTVNVTACTSFGIDKQMIGTALVTTTVENFTQGAVETTGTSIIPEMDPVKFWNSPFPAGPELCDAGDGFNTHLFATSLLRAVSECQQRLNIKPDPDDITRVTELENILSSLHLILPQRFFNTCRWEAEGTHSHRLRLETIIMLNTARLIVHEPVRQLIMSMSLSPDSNTFSLKSWRDSISFADTIAQILDAWPSVYFAVSDPIISCAIWHACCGIVLYRMSGLEPSTPDPQVQGSLESLQLSLKQFTAYWPIAQMLQDSLQDFRAWSWATVDIHKLVGLIEHTRTALGPYSSQPGRVDLGLLCDSVL